MVDKFNFDPQNGDKTFSLRFRGQQLDKKATLKEAEISTETVKVFV